MSDHEPAATDAYEADAMRGAGRVLHRDKHVARGAALAMIPGTLVFLLAGILVALGAEPNAPRALALLPLAAAAWFTFVLLTRTVVRTVLTTERLDVHWGLWGPRIPIAAITACAVVRPKPALPAAAAAVTLLAGKGLVEVEWRGDDGKTKRAQFPANDPDALVAKVLAERARHTEGAVAAGGVRVAGVAATEAGEPAEAPAPDAARGGERAAR